jgi:hypothetical protein
MFWSTGFTFTSWKRTAAVSIACAIGFGGPRSSFWLAVIEPPYPLIVA